MSEPLDGAAIVWCEGAYASANGKTAHGLVRFTRRYRVLAVVDSGCAGRDALEILGGPTAGIPVVAELDEALAHARYLGIRPTHLVIGLAPDGGRLPPEGHTVAVQALQAGLDVDSGLHDFLADDPVLGQLARRLGRILRDVRRPPDRARLHFFTGDIEEVEALKVAVLGTDSAVGKRTTAWMVVHALVERGIAAEFVGTGQTAWLQGARYGVMMDSLVNDFLTGELEHAVVSAWREQRPEVIVVEGQGSLMNPAYPGGYEILAATRPDVVVLQHAPARRAYDGFPGYAIHPIERQIQAIELVSDRPVIALTLSHEGLEPAQARQACAQLSESTGRVCCAPLLDGVGPVVDELIRRLGPAGDPR